MEQVFIYAITVTLACVAVLVSALKQDEFPWVVGSIIVGLISALTATFSGVLLGIRFIIECFK